MKLENINKKFGDKVIFENFSTDISENKITCILGTSGKGKTTLMNMILGIEKPNGGNIEFESKPSFSAVFQDNRLLPFCTALENVMFAGADKYTAKAALCKVGLESEESILPHKLSGGMQRRLALARALCKPNYTHLLLDEPFTGQDEQMKEKLVELIQKETIGKTVILITHDEQLAERIADNIIRI